MVELKNVSFRYGSENVECMYASSLKNIDLTVKTGECVLLTGPSGCGKTTILRLINGLIPHFYPGELSGDILIDGGSVKERELYDTALIIGTVFQNPRTQFYNVDTTGELAFGCENRGLPEQEIYTRIDRTVAHFRMASLMDRNIFRLSDGEKQKIACASVNVSKPKIILLDEPSANLDYTATLMLRELILRWKAEGKTIIAAEHRIAYLWDRQTNHTAKFPLCLSRRKKEHCGYSNTANRCRANYGNRGSKRRRQDQLPQLFMRIGKTV